MTSQKKYQREKEKSFEKTFPCSEKEAIHAKNINVFS